MESQFLLADMAWVLLGGLLLGLLLAWALPKTRLKRLHLVVLVWSVLFVVENFNNALEGYFFTSLISSVSVFVERRLLVSIDNAC